MQTHLFYMMFSIYYSGCMARHRFPVCRQGNWKLSLLMLNSFILFFLLSKLYQHRHYDCYIYFPKRLSAVYTNYILHTRISLHRKNSLRKEIIFLIHSIIIKNYNIFMFNSFISIFIAWKIFIFSKF